MSLRRNYRAKSNKRLDAGLILPLSLLSLSFGPCDKFCIALPVRVKSERKRLLYASIFFFFKGRARRKIILMVVEIFVV